MEDLLKTLQNRCYPKGGAGGNDIAVRYVMDGNDAYLYPAVLKTTSLFVEAEDKSLGALSLTALNSLSKLAAGLQDEYRAALRRNDLVGAQRIKKSIEGAQETLTKAAYHFVPFSSFVPALDFSSVASASALQQRGLLQRDEKIVYDEIDFMGMWRDNLLVKIQKMCEDLGDFSIVKGTNDPQSSVRRDFSLAADWGNVCYRRDALYGQMEEGETATTKEEERKRRAYLESGQVLDDIDENIHVLQGYGRIVYNRAPQKQREQAVYRNLFLAYPGCFTFEYFDVELPPLADRISTAAPLLNALLSGLPLYENRPTNETVFVILDLPTRLERTNQIFFPGIYRLDRTIFLTLKHDLNRTVAVRSDFRQHGGELVYAEHVYFRANFDPQQQTERKRTAGKTYYAGNANLFMAVSADKRTTSVRANDPKRHLLGFVVCCLAKSAYVGERVEAIEYNDKVGSLKGCGIRYEKDAIDQILVQRVLRNDFFGIPEHQVVVVETKNSDTKDIFYDEVRNGLVVDYLCAAQPGLKCPPSLGFTDAPYDPPPSPGFFLLGYALVYYAKYSPTSLTLYTRRWTYKGVLYAEATIANYYNKSFGLQFVPEQTKRAEFLSTTQKVKRRIGTELGLDGLLRTKTPEWFEQQRTLAETLNEDPDMCHFFTLLADAVDDKGLVDWDRVSASPLFDSTFYTPYRTVANRKVASDGRMFRFYPSLAELEMRLVQQFLKLVARQKEKEAEQKKGAAESGGTESDDDADTSIASRAVRGAEETQSVETSRFEDMQFRYQDTLVPENDALEKFAAEVERRAREEANADTKNRGWDGLPDERKAELRTKHANAMIGAERDRAEIETWDDAIDELALLSSAPFSESAPSSRAPSIVVSPVRTSFRTPSIIASALSPTRSLAVSVSLPPTAAEEEELLESDEDEEERSEGECVEEDLLDDEGDDEEEDEDLLESEQDEESGDLWECFEKRGIEVDVRRRRVATETETRVEVEGKYGGELVTVLLNEEGEGGVESETGKKIHNKMAALGLAPRILLSFRCRGREGSGEETQIVITEKWPVSLEKLQKAGAKHRAAIEDVKKRMENEVLAALNENGVVHGNITPEKIVFRKPSANERKVRIGLIGWENAFEPAALLAKSKYALTQKVREAKKLNGLEGTRLNDAFDVDVKTVERIFSS